MTALPKSSWNTGPSEPFFESYARAMTSSWTTAPTLPNPEIIATAKVAARRLPMSIAAALVSSASGP